MSVSIKLATDITWGSSAAGTLTSGKILSLTRKSTNKQFEQPDENGEVHSLVLYDQREEFSIECLATDVSAPPALGSLITAGGVTDILVTEVEIAWKQGDTKKFNITGWKSVA